MAKRLEKYTYEEKQKLENKLNKKAGFEIDSQYRPYRVVGNKLCIIDYDDDFFATTFDCAMIDHELLCPQTLADEFDSIVNIKGIDSQDIVFMTSSRFDKWFLSKEWISVLNKISHMIYVYDNCGDDKIEVLDNLNADVETYISVNELQEQIDKTCPGKIIISTINNLINTSSENDLVKLGIY